jgi:hypothetical protein
MNDFLRAQQLFGEYERTGNLNALEEARDLLEDLVEEGGDQVQRAKNLSDAITRHTEKDFLELTARYNIKDFAKSIEASEHPIYEIVTMMTEEDQHKFLALAGIRRTILVQ